MVDHMGGLRGGGGLQQESSGGWGAPQLRKARRSHTEKGGMKIGSATSRLKMGKCTHRDTVPPLFTAEQEGWLLLLGPSFRPAGEELVGYFVRVQVCETPTCVLREKRLSDWDVHLRSWGGGYRVVFLSLVGRSKPGGDLDTCTMPWWGEKFFLGSGAN